ncbi:MAG: rhodanese-like domain-containing protein [Romboutsia sp.]
MKFLSGLFRSRKYMDMNGNDLNQMIRENMNLIILDVRSKEEYKASHIPNAINIPVDDIYNKLSSINPYKSNIIVVYCQSGQRSARACDILSKNRFEKIYNLKGGIKSYKGKLERY